MYIHAYMVTRACPYAGDRRKIQLFANTGIPGADLPPKGAGGDPRFVSEARRHPLHKYS